MRNENNQEEIKSENKKQEQAEDVIDQEIIYENIEKQNKMKSPLDFQILLNCLNGVIFTLEAESKIQLIDKMFYCTVKDQQMVFKQGDKASLYFIIDSGRCEVIINNNKKKILQSGQSFGELEILYNVPQSTSVKALGNCTFWVMDRFTFRKTIEEISLKDFEQNQEILQKVKCFQSLTYDQRKAISSVLITLSFEPERIIVRKGDQADSFFIIKKGEVKIYKGDDQLIRTQEGDSFEEYSLQNNSVRQATVQAYKDVILLAISRFDLQRILGDKMYTIIFYGQQRWAFQRHPFLKWLTQLQIERIVSNMEQKQYKQGDIIIEKEQQCTHLIVVLMATIQYGQSLIGQGQIFGDQFLEQQNQILADSLIMKSDGFISQIQIKVFFEIIGDNLKEIYQQQKIAHINNIKIKLEELISIKILGQGDFTNIYLVHNKSENKNYSLKCISKAQIIKQNLERHLDQQKQVSQIANFPLIIHYYKSFKDQNYIYFLEEYVKGMQINEIIKEIGALNTYNLQFYIGSLILCMEYFHLNHIIYRNVSPTHVMVDDQGFIKLIGLGTAKYIENNKGKTFTMKGTPHYMAPEIFIGRGYTYSVDLWSIGIMMYEFIYGKVPYGENADDPYLIFEDIQNNPLNFPSEPKDQNAQKLMEQLINKIPQIRLGSSYAILKKKQFFENFNFDSLMNRDLKPPYIPPNTKFINDKEIQKAIETGKLIIEEIKSDPRTINNIYNSDDARNPDWDQIY
ncbi:unnamed protein product [Paramecium sonneborni]|uniref:cGMP-dependent protein kinase n=1 Tax=Paramecium sonneborni TaxID=65129 RepID=A0A8S1RMF2_9CILI|nr:unnamed protein product [Paramecium sonneborni]